MRAFLISDIGGNVVLLLDNIFCHFREDPYASSKYLMDSVSVVMNEKLRMKVIILALISVVVTICLPNHLLANVSTRLGHSSAVS